MTIGEATVSIDPRRRRQQIRKFARYSVAARRYIPRNNLIGACLVSLAVAACASSSPTTSQSILQKVLSSKTLIVGTEATDPPYGSLGSTGQLQGYDIDLANLLAKDLGVKVQFTVLDFAGRVTALQTGKVDVTIADFTPSLARAQVVAFSDPYSVDGIEMLTRTKDNIQSFADLNKSGIKIGIPRGVPIAATLPGIFPKAQIVTFAAEGDTVTALNSGDVQGIAINTPNIGTLIKATPGFYKVVGTSLSQDLDSIGLKQGDFAWLLYLNTFIRQINEDGTNLALWTKYIGGPPPYFIQH
jgi:polar amino acid transport system substrate-binding protein